MARPRSASRRVTLTAGAAALMTAALGTAADAAGPTIVDNVAQLQAVSNNMAGDYRLGGDIDASATTTWNNGAGFIPLGANGATPTAPTAFTGTFDGAGHKITNLTIASSGTSIYTGLFAYIGKSGVVENLSLAKANVTSSYQGFLNGQPVTGYIAALAALNAGHISNVSAGGKVTLAGYQNVVAGLVAWSEGVIDNAASTVEVVGEALNTEFNLFVAAGLVGINATNAEDKARGIVTNSRESGVIVGYIATSGNGGNGFTGGLAGANLGTIEHSHSGGKVGCSGCWIGGLVGWNAKGAVTQSSYSSAGVGSSINGRIGGLVGFNGPGAEISHSHATGTATSGGSNTAVGGLLGWNQGTVTLSWASGNVAGVKGSSSSADIGNFGGLVGYNDETGIVEKSYATGKVTDNVPGPPGGLTLGGLVGDNVGGPKGGRIAECFATGDVTGIGAGSETVVGGLVGLNSFVHANGSVENSYAIGTVTGGQRSPVGAVIGESDDGNAAFVYGVGRVAGGKGAFLGGVIGAVNPGGNIDKQDYWDIATTHQTRGAGRGSQAGLEDETDAALKSGKLPAGFDKAIWNAKPGNYPFLRGLPPG